MPSKFQRVIAVLKDQTSIGIARISHGPSSDASNLDIAVLKATSHDELPPEDCYANEAILLAAASSAASGALVRALSRRIARTRCWVVALKSLLLAYRGLQEAGPCFPRAALTASSRHAPRLLDVSAFSDDSHPSSPWDFTAFIRTFSLYLDARLESYHLGKLHHHHKHFKSRHPVLDMKPPAVLDRIGHWQRLLQRAIGMRPTGAARTNRLIKISLYPVVRESFNIYRDISDGLAVLLGSFFHLPYPVCLETFHVYTRAVHQFDELNAFYALCKSIGIGRASEYPEVQKISKCLLNDLEEFLRDSDAATVPLPSNAKSPLQLLLTAPMEQSEDHPALKSVKTIPASNADTACHSEPSPASGQAPLGNAIVGDLLLFDEQPQAPSPSAADEWELVLVESTSDISSISNSDFEEMKSSPLESSYDQPSYLNPFLIDLCKENSIVISSVASPTFWATKTNGMAVAEPEKDPFLWATCSSPSGLFQTSAKQQQNREQQLWMPQQCEIVSKNMWNMTRA